MFSELAMVLVPEWLWKANQQGIRPGSRERERIFFDVGRLVRRDPMRVQCRREFAGARRLFERLVRLEVCKLQLEAGIDFPTTGFQSFREQQATRIQQAQFSGA